MELRYHFLLFLASQYSAVSAAAPDFTICAQKFHANTLISLSDCETTCGKGPGPWPWAETLQRFTIWLLPELVVLANFKFSPLSTSNTIFIAMRVLGNPIASLWCLLVRYKAQRCMLDRALRLKNRYEEGQSELCADPDDPLQNLAVDLAIIWCAYEEMGMGGAWENFGEAHFSLVVDGYPRESIRLASHRIVATRPGSQLTVWWAALLFVGSLVAAFVRTYREKTNNQTSHSIALVSLLIFSVPMVLLSAQLAVPSSACESIDAIQELHEAFSAIPNLGRVFPDPQDPSQGERGKSAVEEPVSLRELPQGGAGHPLDVQHWATAAAYAGFNGSWRPFQHVNFAEPEPSIGGLPTWVKLMLYAWVTVVVCSFLPALALSYLSGIPGYGCRCIIWTSIVSAWCTNLGLDFALAKCWGRRRKLLWQVSRWKDLSIAVAIVLLVLVLQIGAFNSCQCRSMNPGHMINLGAPTSNEWNRNWKIWPGASWGAFALAMYTGFLRHVVEVNSAGPKWQVWKWPLAFIFHTRHFERPRRRHWVLPVRLAVPVMCKSPDQKVQELRRIGQFRREQNARLRPLGSGGR